MHSFLAFVLAFAWFFVAPMIFMGVLYIGIKISEWFKS